MLSLGRNATETIQMAQQRAKKQKYHNGDFQLHAVPSLGYLRGRSVLVKKK